MSEKHNGFLTYLENGEFTEDFITDYQYWCRRTMSKWNLFISFDEFYNRCWERLLLKMKNKPFDPKIAKFQTYVISTPFEMAQDIWMKNKSYRKHYEVDCDEPTIANSISMSESYFSVFEPMIGYAKSLDIEVDVDEVDSIYHSNDKTILSKAIDWWKLKYERGFYE